MCASSGSASRREFLRDAAVLSAAMASGFGFPAPAAAAQTISTGDGKATLLDLGFIPNGGAPGAVVVVSNWSNFATFRAASNGTGVVELVGCKASTYSYETDKGHDGRPYPYFELKPGGIYQITGSTWLAQIEKAVYGRVSTGKNTTPLRHYVFTFDATNFQCIAEGLKPQLRTESYGVIAADLLAGD